ncbi:MAG: hypothetical protein V4726_00090 [Verrucomicrobiota bacterium]
MRKQNSDSKSPPPSGGRRNHSRFAPLYEEICRLRAKRLTWQEIAEKLSLREGVKLNRTALWKMWDNRQRGAVREEFMPPEPQVSPLPAPRRGLSSGGPDSAQNPEVADESLGITPEQPEKVILKVRSRKSGVPPLL